MISNILKSFILVSLFLSITAQKLNPKVQNNDNNDNSKILETLDGLNSPGLLDASFGSDCNVTLIETSWDIFKQCDFGKTLLFCYSNSKCECFNTKRAMEDSVFQSILPSLTEELEQLILESFNIDTEFQEGSKTCQAKSGTFCPAPSIRPIPDIPGFPISDIEFTINHIKCSEDRKCVLSSDDVASYLNIGTCDAHSITSNKLTAFGGIFILSLLFNYF